MHSALQTMPTVPVQVEIFVERQTCPACQSNRRKTLYACDFLSSPVREYLEAFYAPQGDLEFKYLEQVTFILDQCLVCGLVYQRQVPNELGMSKLYNEWLDPEIDLHCYEQQHSSDHYADVAQDVMMLLSYFQERPSQLKVFDFGMGWGGWTRMANGFGCEVYGYDLSQRRAVYARTHGVRTLEWADIPNHRFDFINTEQVLEHVAEPLDILYYLKRALKPGGLLRIDVPNGHDIRRQLRVLDWSAPKGTRNSLNAVAPLEHINCFTHETIVSMAEHAGLVRVKIPLRDQYRSCTPLRSGRHLIRSLLRPLYRNFLRRSTSLFFMTQPVQPTGEPPSE